MGQSLGFSPGGAELSISGSLSKLRIHDLLREVQDRVIQITSTQDRLDGLLEAILTISSGLELQQTLEQVAARAAQLVNAGSAVLGVVDHDGGVVEFIPAVDAATAERLAGLPTGRDESGQRSFVVVSVGTSRRSYGWLYVTDPLSGRDFDQDDEVVLRALAGAAGAALGNAELFDQVQRRGRWLQASEAITSGVLSGEDPDATLRRVASTAAELAQADVALLCLPEDPDTPAEEVAELAVRIAAGPEAGSIAEHRIPVAGSTTGAVFTDQIPRRVDHLAVKLTDETGQPWGPAVAVPLRGNDHNLGVLAVLRAVGKPEFNSEQLQIVANFADHAAIALHHTTTRHTMRELELLADRDRIAADLHDHVIHHLLGISTALVSTQRRAKSPQVAGQLLEWAEQLHQVVNDIRATVFDVHADPSGQLSLRQRLNIVIADSVEHATLRTSILMSGSFEAVDTDLGVDAEAVLREALSNAVRHSQASTLDIDISLSDQLRIEVTDNGIGIPDTLRRRSGLANLHQRATNHGGHCRLEHPSEGGTRLVWTVPLPPTADRHH